MKLQWKREMLLQDRLYRKRVNVHKIYLIHNNLFKIWKLKTLLQEKIKTLYRVDIIIMVVYLVPISKLLVSLKMEVLLQLNPFKIKVINIHCFQKWLKIVYLQLPIISHTTAISCRARNMPTTTAFVIVHAIPKRYHRKKIILNLWEQETPLCKEKCRNQCSLNNLQQITTTTIIILIITITIIINQITIQMIIRNSWTPVVW